MKIITRFCTLFLIATVIWVSKEAQAIVSITVTGSWSETIDASNLQTGAGKNLIDSHESARDAIEIDIDTFLEGDWMIDVNKVDTNWHSSFNLYVKRTSDGSGSGSISGGTSYQEATYVNETFFSGRHDRSNIHVQLKFSGVSIQVPPDTYSTMVYYTVVHK
jgi:hypothetical protein